MKHPSDMSNPIDEEPPNKKMRTEESLMPEAQFLAKYKVGVNHWRAWIFSSWMVLAHRAGLLKP